MRSPGSSVGSSVAIVVIASLACGGSGSQPTLSSGWTAPTILANVPADSPYVIASLDVVSEATRRRFMSGRDRQLVDALSGAARLDGDERKAFAPWVRAARALRDEVRGKDMASWGKEIGFDPDGRFVLYGLSIWPVARIELADPDRLRGVIQRVLAAAGAQPRQASHAGHSYWIAGNAEISFVAAVLQREAVAAILPTRALQGALPVVLGLEKPAQNLGSTQVMPELLGRHHFLGWFVGYFDTRNLLDVFTAQRTSELDAPLRTAAGPIAPACRSDLERLAALVPRVAFGYRKLDEAGFDAAMVLETPPDVTSALRKLHAVVPEVTTSPGARPLFSFGAAINPDELIAWMRGVATQLRDRPFACPWFTAINEAGEQVGNQFATPLPPMFKGVRGFSVTVDNATITPMAVDGHMIIAGDRIADTVSSLAGTIPWLAGIPLKRDGRPVAIPTQQLGLPISGAHVAMAADRVVIATGAASVQRATEHLATPAPKSSPLFMLTFDVPRVKTLLESISHEAADSFDYLGTGNFGMSIDVADGGLGLAAWGTWDDAASAPPAPAAAPPPSRP
jgi:hypothetical protein